MTWQKEQASRVAEALRQLAAYLDSLGMRAVCDDKWGLNRAMTSVPEIPLVSMEEAEATVAADPSVVWLTGGGHWMGTPAEPALHRALTPGRLYAIVIRSALSGRYYGTELLAYTGSIPGGCLVRFCDGEVEGDRRGPNPSPSGDHRGQGPGQGF